MPALRAEWSRPWSPEVVASDASELGFGVCRACWDSASTAKVGRQSERERFRRIGGHNARESALTSAGFVRDDVTGQWAAGELDDEEYLEASGWQLDGSFVEVPASMLSSSDWSVACQGHWRRDEHIVHLEARALVKAMEVVTQDLKSKDVRQLFLVDSMSAALAFGRCRSRNYRLLRQVRKFCSMSIGFNLAFSIRWIPSEVNPADEPSRSPLTPTKPVFNSPYAVSYVTQALPDVGKGKGRPDLHGQEGESSGRWDCSGESQESQPEESQTGAIDQCLPVDAGATGSGIQAGRAADC